MKAKVNALQLVDVLQLSQSLYLGNEHTGSHAGFLEAFDLVQGLRRHNDNALSLYAAKAQYSHT